LRLFSSPGNRPRSSLLILGLGSLSGLLFWGSIPKADVELLAWVCLVPCFLALSLVSRPHLFYLGLIAGLIAGVGRTYWITEPLQLYGNLTLLQAFSTNVLLILYLALYWGLFFVICSRLKFSTPLFAWIAASLWVLLEWTQTWLFTGFPWELLGCSQYLNLPLLQLVSMTGVYGLSFLIVLVNASLAQAMVCRIRPLAFIGPPVLLLAAVLVFGYHRLEELEAERGDFLKVGIVQGSIPQDLKWKTDRVAATTRHYAELTRSLPADQLDLIIFPETALPFYFRHPYFAENQRQITSLAREMKTPILVGTLGGSWEKGIYNRAFLVDAKGQIRDFADKVHLVPFGEYLPLAFFFQYLEGLIAESGAYVHGGGHKALSLPGADLSFGVFICYESIFPEITRTLTRLGASFLINTTNDAWFGYTAAPYQHFSMAVVRAVETGRPVLRAANTGISGLISASGRILHATGLFETTVFTVSVQPRLQPTLYARYGDVFLTLCAVFLAGAALWNRRQGIRQIEPEPQQAQQAQQAPAASLASSKSPPA